MRLKHILKSSVVHAVLCSAAATYVRLVARTSRQQSTFHPHAIAYLEGEKNAIFVHWHEQLLLMPLGKPKKGELVALVSSHNDGQLIAGLLAEFGIRTESGSSSKGGLRAILALKSALKAGYSVTIVPDGPRGPARKLQPGVVMLARASGVPILPVAIASTRYKRLNSWDRFMIAMPFSRLMLVADAPIFVPSASDEAQREEFCQIIEQRLEQLRREVGLNDEDVPA